MRRSKEYRKALSALTWSDGRPRWDTTRSGCFHCGKTRVDVKRNLCTQCRTDDFTPDRAPADNPMARGYRVCTDHCTTVPLPLHFFANGNRKCLSCLQKRRMRKLRKRDPNSPELAALMMSSDIVGTTSATLGLDHLVTMKKRRSVCGAVSARRVGRRYCGEAVVEEEVMTEGDEEFDDAEYESPCDSRVMTTRRSARAARTRVAELKAVETVRVVPKTGYMSADTLSGDETGEGDDASPTPSRKPSLPRLTVPVIPTSIAATAVTSAFTPSVFADWSVCGVPTPRVPASPFTMPTLPLPLSPTPVGARVPPTPISAVSAGARVTAVPTPKFESEFELDTSLWGAPLTGGAPGVAFTELYQLLEGAMG